MRYRVDITLLTITIVLSVLSAITVYAQNELPERYHFTPPSGWMNDPNGLVYYDGEYHLFYQYNPDDLVWGPMHWGHAVSTNLVDWEHLPIALEPDELGTIFSGSAVVDWNNTAGFGEEALVAIFTHANGSRQSQSIAYSTDRGRTWTKYDENPVVPQPANIRNFRDPKVFWYESEGGEAQHWVMLVSAGVSIFIYTSPDLITWEMSDGFGIVEGATCGVWETPDLFELSVDGTNETRWVMPVAIGGCAPAGGTGTQYFIGDFDGFEFTNENDRDTVLWADFGADFYAPQSWSNAPGGRRVWLAWMSNWTYAEAIPFSSSDDQEWRGEMTIPRDLSLINTPDGIRLSQQPIPELLERRTSGIQLENIVVSDFSDWVSEIDMLAGEIVLEFDISDINQANRIGVRLRSGDNQETIVGYGYKAQQVFVSRGQSGSSEISDAYTTGHTAEIVTDSDTLRIHIMVDRESVEVFAANGTVVMTDRIFPDIDSTELSLFVEGGSVNVLSLEIYPYE